MQDTDSLVNSIGFGKGGKTLAAVLGAAGNLFVVTSEGLLRQRALSEKLVIIGG